MPAGPQFPCRSKGGINAVIFASRYSDVPKIVNLAGRFRCREGTLSRFGSDILERLAREKAIPRRETWGAMGHHMCSSLGDAARVQDFLNRCNLDMEGMARSVDPSVRMLCLHGTGDKTIPVQDSELCADLVPNSQLTVVEDADHNFSSPQAGAKMARRVVDFVLS